jgi:DNA-binding NarL/FixJ family response regulator
MVADNSERHLPIRVLIADDQALIRAGICMLLAADPDIEVVAQAEDGATAVAMALELRPDIVIMDLRMPGMDGVEATRQVIASAADPDRLVKVLVLTTFDDDQVVYEALRAGAHGFLIKHVAPQKLIEALRSIAAGESWIDSSVAGKVIKALQSIPQAGLSTSAAIARLTQREREVLELMAQGLSNSDISRKFVLSEATVRTHVTRIIMKTGSRDRTQAVVMAYQSGLVVPPARS